MFVKRVVFINRAPFSQLDLSFEGKSVISLTGFNGSGKTTIMSYIVDAFHEIARKRYGQEFSGGKEGKLYRISSDINTIEGAESSLVYICFDYSGQSIHYIDLQGDINEDSFGNLIRKVGNGVDLVLNYAMIENQLRRGERYAKYVLIDDKIAHDFFANNIATYFPSYRYEQPGYLNDVYQMELYYKNRANFNGYLPNPIEITSDLPQIANWMMDVVLDKELYNDSRILNQLNWVLQALLSPKFKMVPRIGIGPRYAGGARIQVMDAEKNKMIYPSIFNISAGESALLCLFGELLKQADRVGKTAATVEGVVLVDEIDKHINISLQIENVPLLMKMFPNVQFIISTHSPFINMGMTEKYGNKCSIFDLNTDGVECLADENDVFKEVYDVIISKNNQYLDAYKRLSAIEKDSKITRVYLEGRTDEKYFRRAMEVFGCETEDFEFQWVGHIDDKGQEVFTGASSLNQAIQFLKGRILNRPHIFLFDCDTKKQESEEGNIFILLMKYYAEHTTMNKGIENALELDGIDTEAFYITTVKTEDYGKTVTISELDKMKMCEYICSLDNDVLEKVFQNLLPVINRIMEIIKRNDLNEK